MIIPLEFRLTTGEVRELDRLRVEFNRRSINYQVKLLFSGTTPCLELRIRRDRPGPVSICVSLEAKRPMKEAFIHTMTALAKMTKGRA